MSTEVEGRLEEVKQANYLKNMSTFLKQEGALRAVPFMSARGIYTASYVCFFKLYHIHGLCR